MFIIITTGIVIIIAVIIVTIVIKCTCNNNTTPQESFPQFDANTIPPNYGYTASKAHQKSSWACTSKGGQYANTHIWETPLPDPHDGEYTLSESMNKQLDVGGQPDQNQLVCESSGIGATSHHFLPEMPLNVNQSQTRVKANIQAQQTMPVKLRPDQLQANSMITSAESEYTMPVKINEQRNPIHETATSDYTISVLPQPMPNTPDSESEYTVQRNKNNSGLKEIYSNGRSSLQKIL